MKKYIQQELDDDAVVIQWGNVIINCSNINDADVFRRYLKDAGEAIIKKRGIK